MTFRATSDQRRAAVLEQDRPWRRSDDPGQRTGLKWGGCQSPGIAREVRPSRVIGFLQPLLAQ